MEHLIKEGSKIQNLSYRIYLTIIFLLALLLRIYKLGENSLRTDECITFLFAKYELLSEVITAALNTKQQPLYYILVHFWIKLFGASEVSLKLTSVIFGLALILAVYKLGELLFKSKEAGIISSILVALSVFHIDYSRYARPYTLSAFLSITSVYFFVRVLEKDNLKNMILYLIFSSLLLYTHSEGAFILIGQFLFIVSIWFLWKKENRRKLAACLLLHFIVFLSFLPWFFNLVIIIWKNPAGFLFWVPEADFSKLLYTLTDYFAGSPVIFVIYLCLITAGIYLSSNKQSAYLLLLLLLVPFFILYCVSILWKPVYVERYTFTASVPYFILIASGIAETRKYLKVPLGIILLLLSSLLYFFPVMHYQKTYYPFLYKNLNWKSTQEFINQNANEHDVIITDSAFINSLIFNYYPLRKGLKVISFPYSIISVATYESISTRLEPTLAESKRVWLLKHHSEDKNNFIEKKINEHFELKDKWSFIPEVEFYRLDIKLYTRR